jgi:hypothetical protein
MDKLAVVEVVELAQLGANQTEIKAEMAEMARGVERAWGAERAEKVGNE